MYTIWKLQVLATYCFLFQGNPLSIKRDIDILLGPLVKLQTAELNGWADVSVGTLALTPNGLVACHPCIKLIVQCCRRRNYLNISLYLKWFRPILRKICDFEKKWKNIYSTWCSQAVTHLSTNHARRCLTSVIGREPVPSTWYGRRQEMGTIKLLYSKTDGFHQTCIKNLNFLKKNKCRVIKFYKMEIIKFYKLRKISIDAGGQQDLIRSTPVNLPFRPTFSEFVCQSGHAIHSARRGVPL